LRARFSAAAAHELRSPLATIRLHSEMLAGNLGKPGLAREYADRVSDEVDRLGRVVTNTLGYARLEEGRLEVACETGDLAGCVLSAVESLRPGLELTGACIEVAIQEDLPPARFDPEAIHQVVQNLLDNAEKFSRRAGDRTIRVGVKAVEDSVLLTVSDRGPGVPAGVRRKLFRPFAADAGEGANEGLGLGLVLVRALVRAMGGDVSYSDNPGGGALFTVRIPAEDPLALDTPD
jgi:two-component system sensor histidine kinase KdpD